MKKTKEIVISGLLVAIAFIIPLTLPNLSGLPEFSATPFAHVPLMIAMFMAYVSGEKFGVNLEDVENWLKEFKEEYLTESKMGELVETIRVFYAIAKKFLA